MSAVGINNLQLKASISAGIGEVNNKVISQALPDQCVGLQRLNPRGFILVNYDGVPMGCCSG